MTQIETKAIAHADYKSSLGYNYNECKSSFVDGAEWMLSKVFEILKEHADNYSVEVGNAVETYVIDDIRESLGYKVMKSRYKVLITKKNILQQSFYPCQKTTQLQ